MFITGELWPCDIRVICDPMGDEGEGRVIHMTLMKGKSKTLEIYSHLVHAWFHCPLILSGVTIDPGIYISRGHYLLSCLVSYESHDKF
jgi:hypothetical protein